MFTNYYLINRKDEKFKEDFEEFLTIEVGELKGKLIDFTDRYELEKEDEIREKVRDFISALKNEIVKTEGIYICNVTPNALYWNNDETFRDIEHFKKFYEANKEKYFIVDLSRNKLTLEEFLNILNNVSQN